MGNGIFGTDGIRGQTNKEPMTAHTVLTVGMAAGRYFRNDGSPAHRVVIGKDTRLSGYMFENALTAGFTSTGMNVLLLGPVPTPAVGYLTRTMRADCGVMISASHNPYYDNGIKFFGADGFKLSNDAEIAINEIIKSSPQPAQAKNIGYARRIDDGRFRYAEWLKSTFPVYSRLNGLKIVMDCAHGAAYNIATELLWELGAEIYPLGTEPDGFNINYNCGSNSPENAAKAVIKQKADLGICLDGDADRIILIDEKGGIINGDQLLCCFARDWKKNGTLTRQGVVATVMSNLAMEYALKKDGIALHRTNVGDRYVVEAMRKGQYNLGGEQSGHIVQFKHGSTTGDGLLSALQYLSIMVRSNSLASTLGAQFQPMPQILKNARINIQNNKANHIQNPKIEMLIRDVQSTLGKKGRVLVRESGTEPVIRVMLEGEDNNEINTLCTNLVQEIETLNA